jgi:hypothetical protein
MNDHYEQNVVKSRDLKEEFLELLSAVLDHVYSQVPATVVKLYYNTFKQIGFDVGVKGLMACFIDLKKELPSIGKIAELGGRPITKPLDAHDRASILASRTLQAVEKYKDNQQAVKSQVGDLGLQIVEYLGGTHKILSVKPDQHLFLLSRGREFAEIVIKQNPHSAELEKIAEKPVPYIQNGAVKHYIEAVVTTQVTDPQEPLPPGAQAIFDRLMTRRKNKPVDVNTSNG